MAIKITPAFDVVIQIVNQTIIIIFSRPPGSEILKDLQSALVARVDNIEVYMRPIDLLHILKKNTK
jgi:hypothetical protein